MAVQVKGIKAASKVALWIPREIQRTLKRFMPEQPYVPPEVEINWSDFKRQVRWWHFAIALASILTVIALVVLLIEIPVMSISLLSIFTDVVDAFADLILGRDVDVSRIIFLVILFSFIFLRYTLVSREEGKPSLLSALPAYAMREEREYRAGSEKWSLIDKIRACTIFGLMHLSMIIVPLGVAIALSVAGAICMAVYLAAYKRGSSVEGALIQAAVVHTAHNLFALALMYGIVVYGAIQGSGLILDRLF